MANELSIAVVELLHAIGKLALEEGETWRLEHPGLMSAYQACVEEIKKLSMSDFGQ